MIDLLDALGGDPALEEVNEDGDYSDNEDGDYSDLEP
jgi:hypothetical protein